MITPDSGENQRFYPMSFQQRQIWYFEMIDRDSQIYNLLSMFRYKGILDTNIFKLAVENLSAKHVILKSVYRLINDEPVQVINDALSSDDFYLFSDLADVPGSECEKKIAEVVKVEREYRFNLEKGPIIRIKLFKLAADSYIILLNVHHIIVDAQTVSILLKKLLDHYTQLRCGEIRDDNIFPYHEYAETQLKELAKDKYRESEKFWTLLLNQPELPYLNLPTDYPRPSQFSYVCKMHVKALDNEFTRKLNHYCIKKRISLFTLLLTSFYVLLHKYSGQDDIIIGTFFSDRYRFPKFRDTIGLFVNTLPLRIISSGEYRLDIVLAAVNHLVNNAYRYQGFPFEKILEKTKINRSLNRSPIFSVAINMMSQFLKYDAGNPGNNQYPIEEIKNFQEFTLSDYDLLLNISLPDGEKLDILLEYQISLFSADTIERMVYHFQKILKCFIENTVYTLDRFPMISEEEIQQILFTFNSAETVYPNEKSLWHLFIEQVERTPDHTALVGPGTQGVNIEIGDGTLNSLTLNQLQLSYGELKKKSWQLASSLKEKGVSPDTIVGLMVERSVEMIVGILGILKAGGAYLPIDAVYPEERIKYMLLDSAAKIVVTIPALVGKFEKLSIAGCHPVMVSEKPPEGLLGEGNSNNIYRLTNSNIQFQRINLTYVIYTSGSTGEPKGAMLEDRNLVNLILWSFESTNLDFSCVLQFFTISFDVSFLEIFSTLLGGGKLCLVKNVLRTDIVELFRFVERNIVRTVCWPISFLKVIFNESLYIESFPRCIRHIQTAGEQVVISERFASYLRQNRVFLHNHYGPSETHVVTAFTLDPADDIPPLPPIGKPISNTKIYILDRYLNVQPVVIAGELFVGGLQVGRGYLNRPELTAEKFVINHLSSVIKKLKRDVNNHWSLVIGSSERVVNGHSSLVTNERSHRFTNDQCPVTNDRSDKDHMQSCNQAAMPLATAATQHSPHSTYSMVYRTGDLCRWLADGNIEFLGRQDNQVKIHGFRIELSEIEYQLLKHPKIKEAAAVIHKLDELEKQLGVYYIEKEPTDGFELREYLSKILPPYMIPAFFIRTEKIPLTPNGKVNRKALPGPVLENATAGNSFKEPTTEMEKILLNNWKKILHLEKVGINDNIFELGGNSLTIMRLNAKLKEDLGRDIPIVKMFQYPSIHSLARYLSEEKSDFSEGDRSVPSLQKSDILTGAMRKLRMTKNE